MAVPDRMGLAAMEQVEQRRPRLFTSERELVHVRVRAKRNGAVAGCLDRLTKNAEPWLKAPASPPAEGGGFYHDPGSNYEVTVEHYRHARAARDLALLFWIRAEEAYAVPAREILLTYARTYTTFAVHDKEGRTSGKMIAPGRATPQAINEAKWVIPLAWAYDLLYDRFDASERTRIEEGLFHPAARLMMGNDEGRHNHQSWYNAGVGVIGYLLTADEYIQYALHRPRSGFHAQMQSSLTDDGFWYEGSGHYHFFALEALLYLAEAATSCGDDLYRESGLKAMFDFPLRLADPAGRLPRINDGRHVDLSQSDRVALYEIGARRYGDPVYKRVLAGGARTSLYFLLFGEILGEAPVPPQGGGEVLSPGLAVLRKGEGTQAAYAVLNLMPYAGGHSHPDKLGLIYFGGGQMQAPDSGSIRYRDPLHLKWFKRTIAHNTVTVDLNAQVPSEGASMTRFVSDPRVDMVRARSIDAYPGVCLDRSLILTPTYLLDVFRLTSEEFHWWDWVYRNFGRIEPPPEAERPDGEGCVPGYDEIQLDAALETNAAWSCRWHLARGNAVSLQMMPGERTNVYFGRAPIASFDRPDTVDPRPIDTVVVRRRANSALFAALIQPLGSEGRSGRLRSMADPVTAEGVGLVVEQDDGTADHVLIGYGEAPVEVGPWRVQGGPVWLRVEDRAVKAVVTCGHARIEGGIQQS